ncbi:MAG: zinc ribbon domain-containing protein [Thermogutta sp.]|nr:zinc ribbon domain-containing protein [Thermogutta sp.]HPU07888.1 zinc ribbon domain-containing protein [Thermogutta sp.]HPZ84012.1 zinc ribbon domain-containing protein [Thermogutta sp.]HQF12940.1 zinc ribbon domain-containing protein [Thermogutta sp.]
MPTYEYLCEACEHRFEEFQSITADPLTKCPACGKKKLRRLIGTGGAILFKGSGFYCTDYRSESYRKAAARDNGNGSSSSKSSETSSSTKSNGKD